MLSVKNSQTIDSENFISERVDSLYINNLNKVGYEKLECLNMHNVSEYIDIANIKKGDCICVKGVTLECRVVFDGYVSLESTGKYKYTPIKFENDLSDYLPF